MIHGTILSCQAFRGASLSAWDGDGRTQSSPKPQRCIRFQYLYSNLMCPCFQCAPLFSAFNLTKKFRQHWTMQQVDMLDFVNLLSKVTAKHKHCFTQTSSLVRVFHVLATAQISKIIRYGKNVGIKTNECRIVYCFILFWDIWGHLKNQVSQFY